MFCNRLKYIDSNRDRKDRKQWSKQRLKRWETARKGSVLEACTQTKCSGICAACALDDMFSGLNTPRKALVNAKTLTPLECTSDRKNSIRKTNGVRESEAKIPNFYIKYTTKRQIPVCFERDHLLQVNYSNPYTCDRQVMCNGAHSWL